VWIASELEERIRKALTGLIPETVATVADYESGRANRFRGQTWRARGKEVDIRATVKCAANGAIQSYRASDSLSPPPAAISSGMKSPKTKPTGAKLRRRR
jgi:hypothetical protein